MNKFPYIAVRGEFAGTTPPPDTTTGWLFSDTVIQADCPKCGSQKGFYCETPRGRKAWPPHTERMIPATDAHKMKVVRPYDR